MITNFEDITEDLTPLERDEILPVLVRSLKTKIGKENIISQGEACAKLKEKFDWNIRPERWRKMINVTRRYGLVENLVSTSKGYYIATDKMDAWRNIQSIQDRINALEELKEPLVEQAIKTFGK